MAAYSGNLSPNVVKTALDDVFFQEFNLEDLAGVANAMTPDVFKQASADKSAVIEEVFKGVGYWDSRQEEEDVANASPRVGNQITFSVINYAKSVDISKNMFDDDQHSTVDRIIRDFAETGRLTRDRNAFSIYRNAFGTTLTADGVALCSNSHVTLSGATVDNLLTATLSPSSVNSAFVMLVEQKAQDGTIRGAVPQALLVPPALWKEAKEIVESLQAAQTADNDTNVFRQIPLRVWTSPHLGAAAGDNGSDTAWFLLGRTHSVTRWVRQAIQTSLVDWQYQRNNNYIFKAEYREVLGAIDYVGIVGSNGSA